MRSAITVSAALAILASGGCTTPLTSPSADTTSSRSELRVFVGPCLGTQEAGALLAPVAGAIISNTLDRFGAALRRLGDQDTHTEIAFRNLELAAGAGAECIQIVKGRFDGTKRFALQVERSAEPHLLPEKINLGTDPDFFVELYPRVSANREFVALRPTLLKYRRLLKDGSEPTGSERSLMIQLSFHPAGKPPDDQSAIGTTINLGRLAVGTARNYGGPPFKMDPGAFDSPWFPSWVPAAADAVGGGAATNAASDRSSSTRGAGSPRPADSAPTSPASPNGRSASKVPKSLTVTFTETRSARPWLLFLADVFDDSKEDVATYLETKAVREKRQQARDQADQVARQALIDYYTAFADAEARQLDYCALPRDDSAEARKQRLEASNALFAAQTRANLAALPAGRTEPYATTVQVSSAPPTGCR